MKTMAFGVFNDEGLLCGDFKTVEEAWAWTRGDSAYCAEEDGSISPDIKVSELCHDHPEHAADTCELCEDKG